MKIRQARKILDKGPGHLKGRTWFDAFFTWARRVRVRRGYKSKRAREAAGQAGKEVE